MNSLFSLLLVLLIPSLVAGNTPHTSKESRLVLMSLPHQVVHSEEAVAAIRSELEELLIALETHPISEEELAHRTLADLAEGLSREEGVEAVIWIDREDPTQLLFLTAREDGFDTFKRIIPQDTTESLKIENVAMICRATVQALLAIKTVDGSGSQMPDQEEAPETDDAEPIPVEMKQEPIPPTEPVPVKTPAHNKKAERPAPLLPQKRKRPPMVGLNLAYAYHTESAEHLAISGFQVGIHGRIGKMVRLFATYEVQQSMDGAGSCIDTTVKGHPVSLGGEVHWSFSRFSLGPKLAFILDYTTRESTLAPECKQVNMYRDKARFKSAILAGLLGRYRLFDRLSLFASLGVRVFVMQREYSAPGDDGDKELLIDPWKFQPSVIIGILVGIF